MLLALAVHRFAFFGRTALSFVVVLPIALIIAVFVLIGWVIIALAVFD